MQIVQYHNIKIEVENFVKTVQNITDGITDVVWC